MNDLYLRSDADRGGAGLRLRSYADKLTSEEPQTTGGAAWMWAASIRRRSRQRLEDEFAELELLDVL